MKTNKTLLTTLILSALLTACSSDDGKDGSDGANGNNGQNGTDGQGGAPALVSHTPLEQGHFQCMQGGMQIDSGTDLNTNAVLDADEITHTSFVCNQTAQSYFQRISTFPVCKQIEANCDTDDETVAEISAASKDGNVVYYTDGEQETFGMVDISNPASPTALGTVNLPGEPTSITVLDDHLLAVVNTSDDDSQSGSLEIYDISDTASPTAVRSIALDGQPDSIAVSKDGRFAAIVIENERLDEDLPFPQTEAGELKIISTDDDVADWALTTVSFTGLAEVAANDPEPEYVDINDDNIAVVTMQENNHIALVDLESAEIINHFSAGTVDLTAVDIEEEDQINLTGSLADVPREPDGVSWINNDFFATADEGDFEGGSRGFTVYNKAGTVVYSSANELEHLAVRFGHYPDGRSENKGNEPENAEVGTFGDDRHLFVASERANLVFVYDANDADSPQYKQTLPSAVGPEGILAIPERNLLIVSSEKDDRGDKMRAAINIYQYGSSKNRYPSVQSSNDDNGNPIPWSALSGLAASDDNHLYSIEDSAYQGSRIFKIDTNKTPALITHAIKIEDTDNVLANFNVTDVAADAEDDSDARKDVFDSADLAAMINTDGTVNLDPEGIAMSSDDHMWVVSEGNGTVGDDDKPINSVNLLLKLDMEGVIKQAHRLPESLEQVQLRFGFEGVAESDNKVYIAMQRPWNGESHARIAEFDPSNETWTFFNYPLDAPSSQNGGWVALGEITALEDNKFLVLERDNQGGPDAAIKKIYQIDLTNATESQPLTKTLVRDLLPDLTSNNNLAFEKVEGLAVMPSGDVYIINDNDGVDDNSGETQLLNLGKIL